MWSVSLSRLDVRDAAFAAFAAVAVVNTARWFLYAKTQRTMKRRLETPPVLSKDALLCVIADLVQPVTTVSEEAMHRATAAGAGVSSDADAKVLCATLYDSVAQELAHEEAVVFKKHGVSVSDVEDTFRYYSVHGDLQVQDAAAPIRKQAGKFLLSKPVCLRLVQAAAERQCEEASKVVDQICQFQPVTPQNAQMVFNAVMEQLQRIGEITTQALYGVSFMQVLEFAQKVGADDPVFWNELNACAMMPQQAVQQHLTAMM